MWYQMFTKVNLSLSGWQRFLYQGIYSQNIALALFLAVEFATPDYRGDFASNQPVRKICVPTRFVDDLGNSTLSRTLYS